MESTEKQIITIQTIVNVPINLAWKCFSSAEDIQNWYFASEDWHAPYAENDLKIGGKFKTRMEAKDGSFGFDFEGIYTNIIDFQLIEYVLEDGRLVKISFSVNGSHTEINETFDAETENTIDLQRAGWQAILDNFKRYAESKS